MGRRCCQTADQACAANQDQRHAIGELVFEVAADLLHIARSGRSSDLLDACLLQALVIQIEMRAGGDFAISDPASD
jgi:hypothetical protein